MTNNQDPENEFELKTSRSHVRPTYPAFRIEKRIKEYAGATMYDLIWQANGEDERIHMLIDKRDLHDLRLLLEQHDHD